MCKRHFGQKEKARELAFANYYIDWLPPFCRKATVTKSNDKTKTDRQWLL
jgi:hypothetical protein